MYPLERMTMLYKAHFTQVRYSIGIEKQQH